MNRVEKSKIARNPNTDQQTLRDLSKDASNKVKAAVALNLSCPVDVQKELAFDKHLRVVQKLAKNENLHQETIEILKQHPSSLVLQCLISNPSVDAEVKQKIILSNETVAEGVAASLANDDKYKNILSKHPSTKVRGNFYNNTKDIDLLHAAKYEDMEILFSLVFNPEVTEDILLHIFDCYAEDKENPKAMELVSYIMPHRNMPVDRLIKYYEKYPNEFKTSIIEKCDEVIDLTFYIKNWEHFSTVLKTSLIKRYSDNENIVVEALLDTRIFWVAEDVLLDKHLMSGEATFTRAESDKRNKYIQDTVCEIIRSYTQNFIPNQQDLPYEWVKEIAETLKPSTQTKQSTAITK